MTEMFGFNVIKSLAIILAVTLYWKFVYYKYHKKDITPISIFIGGIISIIIGFYGFFIDKSISFGDIIPVCAVSLVFLAFSFILIFIASRKYGLQKDIDITLTWIDKYLGRFWVYAAVVIAFPVFPFIIAGTYWLLGKEYIILWVLIGFAWFIDGPRILFRHILKQTQ